MQAEESHPHVSFLEGFIMTTHDVSPVLVSQKIGAVQVLASHSQTPLAAHCALEGITLQLKQPELLSTLEECQ